MNKRIKAIVFILVVVYAMTMFTPKSFAGSTAVLQERTLEEIMSKYWERPFKIKNTDWVEYDVEPSSTFPYRAGKVKDEYLQEALDLLNFIRYLVGLPDDIYLDETYINYTQHGAVLLAAVNKLTHHPPQPADMPDEFYEIGYKGTSQSNCAYGFGNIFGTILGYMYDSDSSNIDRVGHRRWLLNPSMQKTGFGYYKRYSATYAFNRTRESKTLYDFISWPAENYMPVEFMSRDIAWSVCLGQEYDRPSMDDVTVTLKRRNDGKTWTFSQNRSYDNSGDYFNVDTVGNYGLPKCIIFRPNIEGYKQNDIFDVTISGISKGGNPAEIKYTVQMFSLLKPTPVKAEKEEGIYLNGLEIALSCDTPDAVIYYTTDGSTPTFLSKRYREPISISETTVIKAFSYINGERSEVSSFHYNIEPVSQWAVEDIEKAISLKLIPPLMQKNYRENINRADFCKLAVNLLVQKTGKTLEELLKENPASIQYNTFTDTADEEILAANALGIVNGVGNGRFNPNGMISRQEAAVMLMRTAVVLGITETDELPEVFADREAFADWAKDAITFVSSLKDKSSNKKIMGGVGNGNFAPLGSYTREQAVVTMLRLFNAVE
ncbi:MAG: dockerin type 1 [Thermoanaerobacteraceae bacterium]|nr:dockerin type 1 [Thermoanaerobacteraceae bacterium]